MKAELIAVGTELLLGQIVNTNAQYLANELAGLGIDMYVQTVVGDNALRIRQALELASKRADLVICTGGLGPTQDDITKQVLAELSGRSLHMHEPSLEHMKAYFAQRGIQMSENNARQALMIEGSTPLLNDVGLAVGIVQEIENTYFVLLPGPPQEMTVMFERYVKPWLRSIQPEESVLFSKMIKFAGIGESSLEEKLKDVIHSQSDPTIAPYAKVGEVALRLSTKAGNEEQARLKISSTETEIIERVGPYIFAHEDIGLEEALVRLMSSKGLSLSAAESCTGGMFSEMITSVSGSSKMYKGGIVCYANETKAQLLQLPDEILYGEQAPGAVSAAAAAALAENTRQLLQTDFSISFTGVAGPETSEGKPVGLVFIGLAQRGKAAEVFETQHFGNRELIKLKACKAGLYELWKKVNHSK